MTSMNVNQVKKNKNGYFFFHFGMLPFSIPKEYNVFYNWLLVKTTFYTVQNLFELHIHQEILAVLYTTDRSLK